ncbi:unnamed protein product [Parnassius apollo]|uniref:(apollo) hypothetical protein n=1 Tax=Parnassius apollo TaxID=110799 RepID=A0A8S3Y4E9_PARAO|nr:unnamed protein product [Parnassius apollo]
MSQKRKINFEHPKNKRRILKEINKKQHVYGPASAAPDMSPQHLEKAKEFMKNFKDVTCDRNVIERATVLQRDSSEWLELRKNLVTSSNFGPICKRKANTGTASLFKNILYPKNSLNVASICHGIEHESQALQLEKQENVKIMQLRTDW